MMSMKQCPEAASDLSPAGKVWYGLSPINFTADIKIRQLGIY